MGRAEHDRREGLRREDADPAAPHRYATPNGEPCPRSVRVDGTIEGSGDCHACGCCLLDTGLV